MNIKSLFVCAVVMTGLAACGGKSDSSSTGGAGGGGGGGGSGNGGTIALASATLQAAQTDASVNVSVTRSGGAAGAASVAYATFDGTATAGTQYTVTGGTLTWIDGDSAAKTVAVPLSNASPFSGSKTFTFRLSAATGATLGSPASATVTITGSGSGNASAGNVQVDKHILVDQFGYRPNDPKVAVVRNPKSGFDASDTITPGTAWEVRKAADGSTVFSGTLTQWNGGATEASSGDQGWWFDFSTVTTAGSYFVYDVQRDRRSPTFTIGQTVYKPVLKAAMKMYYYQRSGMAKTAQYATNWADGASYTRAGQDTEAHDVTDPTNNSAGKVRDMSGGWFDGGDTTKYVTFATTAVHQLLSAYQANPAVFTDDFGIPESGNGIPDVVDEVKFETDWLKKMQFDDGSVALMMGSQGYVAASPPSSDTSARFYVPACTSSTIATAGMLAHASLVFKGFTSLATEADTLKSLAIKAWNNYKSIPTKQTHCDLGHVGVGKGQPADWSADDQSAEAVVAAVYLFAITGDAEYQNYVKANYNQTYLRPYFDFGWSRYEPDQGQALLFYTGLQNADATVSAAIKLAKQTDVNSSTTVYGFDNSDLYRAYVDDDVYHWGSNETRANYGNSNVDALAYGAATGKETSIRTRAEEILHYFHGVNPFGQVYLTNMSSYGATNSMNAILHVWFSPGSPAWGDVRTSTYGPPPGYLPGGPNPLTSATLTPPAGQPRQKSYKDWNGDQATGDPQQSWDVTQPGIYYQAAYVQLLSGFAQ
ncbi:MAG TPA: glycoside hydrolase family 9 protein [Steroidobacteraceae bacterium]|nr:glycoside hydrolase family 9 protein [Steroidobacteraceae bacterium]